MSILINKKTKVIVQGITGAYGRDQAKVMIEYGTNVVAGISPGKGGGSIHGVPIYDTVQEAAKHHEFDASVIYVPPAIVKNSAIEAIDGGAKLLMIAAEGVPLQECMYLKKYADEKGTWIVGPNTLGLISPGECVIGSMAPTYAKKGKVGVITRGGTIAIEIIRMLSAEGIGQSSCIGSGGDRVIGKNPIEYLKLFEEDPETEAVVLIGEIGGLKENQCAEFIPKMSKKVISYILGRCAPPGARMGHIGAIISKGSESFEAKREVLEQAGAITANTPWEVIKELKKLNMQNIKL